MSEYRTTSTLVATGDGQRIDLATALGVTPDGVVDQPTFFNGLIPRPDILAAGVLAVADVAGSRYADAGLAKRLANLDPVVTASGDRLRFESFSACNSVHARLDLLPDGLGSADVGYGTTNVDVNQGLRTALARINGSDLLHLAVGPDELRASSVDQTHVERKVDLPDRWVRGLAEVPSLLAGMELAGEIEGTRLRRLFATLPRVKPPGPTLYVVATPSGWRTTTRRVPGTTPLPGVSRLRGADRILRFTERATLHQHRNGTTAWVFILPGASLTLAVSPDPYRGFSGEGTLLDLLAMPEAEALGLRLVDRVGWSATVDPDEISRATGLEPLEVAAGLSWLAASGRLGYDLSQQAWFHRELPIDVERVLRRNPRLAAARALVDGEAVEEIEAGREWRVRGSQGTPYQVTADGYRYRCSCRWEREYEGGRGPCKHTLAVLIARTGSGESALAASVDEVSRERG